MCHWFDSRWHHKKKRLTRASFLCQFRDSPRVLISLCSNDYCSQLQFPIPVGTTKRDSQEPLFCANCGTLPGFLSHYARTIIAVSAIFDSRWHHKKKETHKSLFFVPIAGLSQGSYLTTFERLLQPTAIFDSRWHHKKRPEKVSFCVYGSPPCIASNPIVHRPCIEGLLGDYWAIIV